MNSDHVIPRVIAATSYWLTFCAVALALTGTATDGGSSALDGDAAQSRRAGADLGRMILVAVGFLALLAHLCTLAVGYRRWRVMSMSRWGVGSAVAGALSYPAMVPVGRLGQWLSPSGGSALMIAMIAMPTIVVTIVLFEVMMRTRAMEHAQNG
jgi:hypothetical protein